jgi:hypothetical protein
MSPMVANECHLSNAVGWLFEYRHNTWFGKLDIKMESRLWVSLLQELSFAFLLKILLGYIPNQKKKQWAWRNIKQLCMYSAVNFLELHWLYETSHMDTDNQAWGRTCWILCWWVSFFHCQIHSRQLLKDTECGTGAGKPGHGSEAHCRTKESRS